jgi:hypothetical protein
MLFVGARAIARRGTSSRTPRSLGNQPLSRALRQRAGRPRSPDLRDRRFRACSRCCRRLAGTRAVVRRALRPRGDQTVLPLRTRGFLRVPAGRPRSAASFQLRAQRAADPSSSTRTSSPTSTAPLPLCCSSAAGLDEHNDDPFRAGPFRYVERLLAHRAPGSLRSPSPWPAPTPSGSGSRAKLVVVHYGVRRRLAGRTTTIPGALSRPPCARPAGAERARRRRQALPGCTGRRRGARRRRGTETPRPRNLAAELGVGDAVLLPGRAGDVAALLRTGRPPGAPRVGRFGLAARAMLASVPVVATRVSSIPSRGRRRDEFVPAENSQALAAAYFCASLDDPARSAGRARSVLGRRDGPNRSGLRRRDPARPRRPTTRPCDLRARSRGILAGRCRSRDPTLTVQRVRNDQDPRRGSAAARARARRHARDNYRRAAQRSLEHDLVRGSGTVTLTNTFDRAR